MSVPSCPGCRDRDERLAALEARVRVLEAHLGRNATNSSLPPSAHPPSAPPPVVQTPTGKKRGAQPGHPPVLRRRLPPERLGKVIPIVPTTCGRCQAPLPAQAGPDDPEPTWHQVAEWPDVAAQVVREASAKHVDETGWKQAGARAWLWVGATALVAAFVIHARRSLAGLQTLWGEAVEGILITDRWSVYGGRATHLRQVCWSHLRRDFQALNNRGHAGQAVGEELLALSDTLFPWWHRVRDGTLHRRTFRSRAGWLREDVQIVLRRGRGCCCAKTAAVCRELLAVEAALWTFVAVEGIEPTNNWAERMLRPAVLWRKGSFGCVSAAGGRFVERMLTVVQTLRLQQRSVLSYLEEALRAHRNGRPAPKLLPTG